MPTTGVATPTTAAPLSHCPHNRSVPRAHPRTRVCIAIRPPWEARPERVTQRAAGQRETQRVVLVHHVGDEVEAGVGVEAAEGGGGQRVHCFMRLDSALAAGTTAQKKTHKTH